MAQARRKRNDTRDGPSVGIAILRHVKHGLRESAFLLLGGIALFLMISLASYEPVDPAWTHTGRGNEEVLNLGGVVGAWFADIVLYFFGYLAFLIPVGIAFAGWRLFRHQTINELDAEIIIFRSLGTVVALGSGCGLASLHMRVGPFMNGSAGGIIGDLTAQGLVGAFNQVGGTLFLLALFFAGLSLATGISWLAVIDFVGKHALLLGSWIKTWIIGLGSWLAQLQQPSTVPSVPPGAEPRSAAATGDAALTRALGAQRTFQRVEPSVEGQSVDAIADDQPPAWDATPVASDTSGIETTPAAVRIATMSRGSSIPGTDSVADAPTRMQRPAKSPVTTTPDPLPQMSLLDSVPREEGGYTREVLEEMSRQVETLLRHFGIEVRVVAVEPGPVITRFELDPAPGVKVSQISNLAKDLARGLSVISVRVVEVIPGKSVIGLEIPNQRRETVYLSELLNSPAYTRSTFPMTLALGKDIGGTPVVANLAKMPHLLVAGTTGSGKSVAVNAMLLSLLYKARPEEVRLILVDPKMLELSVYEDIPHLLAPVVTDMKEAANALRWCVGEMERRYRLMAALKVRNIAGFNRKVSDAVAAGTPIRDPLQKPGDLLDEQEVPVLKPLPFIVVVIDELADMMMIVGKKVEELIARLAQKARASGIHLILATQRPSVDVITGLIKANIPTRIAFQVSSKVDSRTILDQMGAEQLLGHGDMLYLPPGSGFPQRMHGAFVQDHEVNQVVEYLKQTGVPDYLDDVLEEGRDDISGAAPEFGTVGSDSESDPLYDQAVQIVTETRRASISGVQRRLKIGYNRAARMIEEMESAGIVGPLQSNGGREVLAAPPPEA